MLSRVFIRFVEFNQPKQLKGFQPRLVAVLRSVAYQHKTQAASVIPEPEFSSFNPWHLRDFLKDIEEDKNSFRITDMSKITAKRLAA
jgi:hypothetical protein